MRHTRLIYYGDKPGSYVYVHQYISAERKLYEIENREDEIGKNILDINDMLIALKNGLYDENCDYYESKEITMGYDQEKQDYWFGQIGKNDQLYSKVWWLSDYKKTWFLTEKEAEYSKVLKRYEK